MTTAIDNVLEFPEEFPLITAGILFPDKELLITGHTNGYVVKWNLKNTNYEILFECGSNVETLSKSPNNEIAVGCNSGFLFTFTFNDLIQNKIQEATYTKASRIWRTKWISQNSLLVASTYGVLNLFERNSEGKWETLSIHGHNDSIFGLDSLDGNLIVSGDYFGKILIHQYKEGQYNELDQLKIQGSVEAISFCTNGSFATVDEYGHINLFERSSDRRWRSVVETDTASSIGTCILLTNDGSNIFAGTQTELIQFDVNTQQVKMISLISIGKTIDIFSSGKNILVLTDHGLISVEISKVVVPEFAVKYQYSKVSLIGHTGAGKTTLCSLITKGSTENIKSTFGKKVWNWTLQNDDIPERRVVFHDHGGQDTVLDTFLPFLADSDVILVFFKKTDNMTFEKALKIRDELESIVTVKSKIFFVETFIDHPVEDINRGKLDLLIRNKKIIACFKVNPLDGEGIEEFKHQLIETIDWNNTRTMIRSEYVESLEKSINALIENKSTVMSFAYFKQFHEENGGRLINTNHMKFLLENISSQGSIEYYPDVLDTIIFYDEKYNELRSNIPIEADKKEGIISMQEIQSQFEHTDYLKMIDQVYLTYGIAIENGDMRIFPTELKENITNIPEPYHKLIIKNYRYNQQKRFKMQPIKGAQIIKALSDLQLKCIDASKKKGIFAWERNACIYYKYEITGDLINGHYLNFYYSIGGEKESISNRLNNEFINIIERFFGPSLTDDLIDKKKDLKNIKFDVALSFAGEQREYVNEVAIIFQDKGIKVFYDEFFQSHLWGKDFTEYLQTVYYANSNWCIMFISKEYVTKIWPTHERRNALAKDIEVKGGYILPVRFDDTEVPGLNPAVHYLDARKMCPNTVANVFLNKFEEGIM
jgi:hypothetical protein